MKRWPLAPALFLFLYVPAFSQDGALQLLEKLDSVKRSPGISSHFAAVYSGTTEKAIQFYKDKSLPARKFIERLEISFAGFFLSSVDSFATNKTIPAAWSAYFKDSSLSSLQYKLLGINAHINGDIWQALTTAFTLEEIKSGKSSYYDFQKGLVKQYREFYQESLNSDSRIRLLDHMTAGAGRIYGRWLLKRWRKRQMKLAILFYTDKTKFDDRLSKLHTKMDHINRLILRQL